MAGAPEGNHNAARGKEFRQALKRVLSRRSGENYIKGLEDVAEQLLTAALNGEQWAVREIADRFDGKPAQIHGGDDELPPITVREILIRAITEPGDRSPQEG